MGRKQAPSRPYFEEGHRVLFLSDHYPQLRCLSATIIQVYTRPDPDFIKDTADKERQRYLANRSVSFLIKIDNATNIDTYQYKKFHNIRCTYEEIKPLTVLKAEKHLLRYCAERMKTYQKHDNLYRFYMDIVQYCRGFPLTWPLSIIEEDIPQGYDINLLNSFISGARKISKLSQKIPTLALQAEICEEIVAFLLTPDRD